MAKNVEGLHNNSPIKSDERFTTLSPMLASYDADHLADPPVFDGRVPPDPMDLVPKQEKPGNRGAR